MRRDRLTVLALLATTLFTLPAFAQVDVGTEPPGPPRPGQQTIDLLAPVGDTLSGRPWLLTEGLDPGFVTRPGWDTLTRMDWRALPGTFGSAGPSLQAAGAGELVPFRDPAPAFSRNLLVTRDFSQLPMQTEPHLAVNPNDPEHLVLGSIDFNFPSVSSYVSLNGGDTWEGPFQSPFLTDDLTSGGDPVLAFDRDGNIHFATISIGVEEFTFGNIVSFSLVSSIAASSSEDGGFSWSDPVSTSRSGVETRDLQLDALGRLRGTLATSFLDKPWLTVGPHHEDSGQDVLYLTYTKFEISYAIAWIGEVPTFLPQSTETTIELVRSDDGGEAWTEPVAVSPTVARVFGEREQPADTPGVFGTDRVVQGAQPVVSPDGTLFVVWLDTTDDGSMEGAAEIHIARSEDGGESFDDAVIAAEVEEIGFRPRTSFFRFWGAAFPQIAVGPEGDLYVVYTGRDGDRPRDDGNIYLVRSTDDGATWSEPMVLNDDEGDSLQFFPAIDVDPGGTVHVMWGDMRDDPGQTRYHIYYSSSEDGGETWGFELEDQGFSVGDSRVSDFASNPNFGFPFGLFIGDYFSLKATEEDVYMVWADTRLGEFGPTNQKIAFTRQRPITRPEIFVSPAAGPGGQDITVQGFDFQPNMNVFIRLEDATIATARTDQDGQFQTRIFTPVTSEGAQTLQAFDESGNAASSSYFTEFGFDNLRDILGWTDVVGGPRADEFLDEIRQVREALSTEDAGESTPAATNGALLAAGALAAFAVSGGTALFVRWRNNNHKQVDGASGEEQ